MAARPCQGSLSILNREAKATDINYSIENTLERTDREPPELRRERWKEQDCWVVSYVDFKAKHYEVWVVPSQGYSVVRYIGFGTNEKSGKPWRDAVETEYQPVSQSGIWFPRSWTSETSVDGKMTSHEEGRVTEVSLNEPLDPKVFTLAGMEIEPGTAIASQQSNDQGKLLDWTSEKLVGHVNQTPPPIAATAIPVESTNRKWPMYTAVVLAVLTVLALGLYWRARRRHATT